MSSTKQDSIEERVASFFEQAFSELTVAQKDRLGTLVCAKMDKDLLALASSGIITEDECLTLVSHQGC